MVTEAAESVSDLTGRPDLHVRVVTEALSDVATDAQWHHLRAALDDQEVIDLFARPRAEAVAEAATGPGERRSG